VSLTHVGRLDGEHRGQSPEDEAQQRESHCDDIGYPAQRRWNLKLARFRQIVSRPFPHQEQSSGKREGDELQDHACADEGVEGRRGA
jgi:hypothetical protein